MGISDSRISTHMFESYELFMFHGNFAVWSDVHLTVTCQRTSFSGTAAYFLTVTATPDLNNTIHNASQYGYGEEWPGFRFSTGRLIVLCKLRFICQALIINMT